MKTSNLTKSETESGIALGICVILFTIMLLSFYVVVFVAEIQAAIYLFGSHPYIALILVLDMPLGGFLGARINSFLTVLMNQLTKFLKEVYAK